MTKKRLCCGLMMVVVALSLCGCFGANVQNEPESRMDAIRVSGEEPRIKVYKVSTNEIEEMEIERYVQGVLAGEMSNEWPMEALKAQAILARTYVMKFLNEKTSKYENADISTDIREAQAYDDSAINERIEKAVKQTRGLVLSYRGEYPYAWFHAHAGGMTELATVALDYKQDDPAYMRPVQSPDSDMAPTSVKHWEAAFSHAEFEKAAGVKAVASVKVGERGESGRAKMLLVNGKDISAPTLRIALGSTKLKSTLIDKVTLTDDEVIFEGRGYGHGVGMSQWGAYEMAMRGDDAAAIISQYFNDIGYEKLWA